VLLDVALDADWRDGCLVASTSARRVAEHLRVDPGTAASALRALRETGLVELTQHSGPDGKFGLAVYTLHLPDGIEVLSSRPPASGPEKPHTEQPRTENPYTVSTGAESGLVLTCPWDGDRASSTPDLAPTVTPPTVGHEGESLDDADGSRVTSTSRRTARRTATQRFAEQGAFDLGEDL
jgi:hypothetical protein